MRNFLAKSQKRKEKNLKLSDFATLRETKKHNILKKTPRICVRKFANLRETQPAY